MHDAKQTVLSRIEVGQLILVTPEREAIGRVPGGIGREKAREFARPKDKTAEAKRVTDKAFEPDEWSGKVWTLTLDDGTRTERRYGTAHVYVVAESAVPEYHLVDTESGEKHVLVTKGVARVQGWSGGDVHETTPHGHRVHIYPDGLIKVVSPDGAERDAVITPETDDALDERNAGEPDVETATATQRCGQCKGYGVVRKRGNHAGQAYKTANGADAATANGNSTVCPVCNGATLVSSRVA
jgi:hypothetical protein